MGAIKKFYKVCLIGSKTWGSAIIKDARVEYFLNRWSAPKKNAPQFLCVFDNLGAAKRFKLLYCVNAISSIFRCEIRGVVKNPKVDGLFFYKPSAPWGTVFAKKVKLLKKVY
jgi:hypothetical protein